MKNYKNERNFTVSVLNWINGELDVREISFNTLFEAKLHCEKEHGKIKICDHQGRVIHSEERGDYDHKHDHDDNKYC